MHETSHCSSLQFMRTNIPDVFAAGDVTSFPLTTSGDQRVNVGHWQMSQAHGETERFIETPLHILLCEVLFHSVTLVSEK